VAQARSVRAAEPRLASVASLSSRRNGSNRGASTQAGPGPRLSQRRVVQAVLTRAGNTEGVDLDDDLLRALRNAPDRNVDQLAEAIGLPRTNFGRATSSRVRERVRALVDGGLVEAHGRRYRISEHGRRLLAERALE